MHAHTHTRTHTHTTHLISSSMQMKIHNSTRYNNKTSTFTRVERRQWSTRVNNSDRQVAGCRRDIEGVAQTDRWAGYLWRNSPISPIAGSRSGSRKKLRSERSRGVEPGCDGSLGQDNTSPATITHTSSRIAQEPVGTEATNSITLASSERIVCMCKNNK